MTDYAPYGDGPCIDHDRRLIVVEHQVARLIRLCVYTLVLFLCVFIGLVVLSFT